MKEYNLNINDICELKISSDKLSSEWLKNFARIIELKEDKACSRKIKNLHFSTIKSKKLKYTKPTIIKEKEFSKEEWEFHDLRIIKFWENKKLNNNILEMEHLDNHEIDIVKMWTTLYPIYNKSIKDGGLPFHATLLEYKNEGVLIAGHGNCGKSTCAKRVPLPWKPLSDDEAVVFLKDSGEYYAHPFPTWSERLYKKSDRTWNIGEGVKLRAIFFLEQGTIDEVTPLNKAQITLKISASANEVYNKFYVRLDEEIKKTQRTKIFANSCELSKKIPCYTLKATLHGRFWEEMERVLK